MTDWLDQCHFGDCLETLQRMPDGIVNTCVTSPPYFGLRDYGHEGQIGLEPTPDEFIAKLVTVFREVRRVLRDDGTLWVNMGDSYAGYHGNKNAAYDAAPSNKGGYFENQRKTLVSHNGLKPKDLIGIPWMLAFALRSDGWYLRQDIIWAKPNPMPESVTDRCTKSHEYIFLLSKSASYYCDMDAVKEDAVCDRKRGSGPMVNSGTGRNDAATGTVGDYRDSKRSKRDSFKRNDSKRVQVIPGQSVGTHRPDREESSYSTETRNRRSVWTVSTKPYKGAHFATFPTDLIEPCILAGAPAAGKRCDCGEIIGSPTGTGAIDDPSIQVGRAGMSRPRRDGEGTRPITRREQRHHATEMKASPHRAEMEGLCGQAFAHYIRTDANGARPLPESLRLRFMADGWITSPSPCDCPREPAGIVLDPFFGSGTTGQVAQALGRKFIGCELNPAYKALQDERLRQPSLDLESV